MNNQSGVVAIVAFLTFGILLLLGAYFLSFSTAELRISKSEEIGKLTYYLAEAGINQAIWRIKNDEEWRVCFSSTSIVYNCDCANWQSSFTQDTSNLAENSSYEVSIQNSECGKGQIIATSTAAFGANLSQRVVKATVFKATDLFIDDAFLGDGNVATSQSALSIFNGNLGATGNMSFQKQSTVNVYDDPESLEQEGQVLAGGNIDISQSTVNASSTCSDNMCTSSCQSCPTDQITIPAVDFDSDSPNSYKSKAAAAEAAGLCSALCNGVQCSTKCVFEQGEFDQLLKDVGPNGTLTLESGTSDGLFSVYYVDGNFELRGERNLLINGALAVKGSVLIGDKKTWEGGSGANQLTVNDPGLGVPSGLLAAGNIRFGKWASLTTTTITGLLYALGNFELVSVPHLIEITGGQIAGGNFQLTSLSQGIKIWRDSVIITEGLLWGMGLPEDSPIISIEHWEESY